MLFIQTAIRDSRENLLIMIVEARQELEGPRGLQRVRVLIVGGRHAAAVVDVAASAAVSDTSVTGTGRVTTGVINRAVATTAGDGGDDAAADSTADLLLLHHRRRHLLPL